MPNVSPVKYDSAFQLRTDPVFRAKVEEMVEATERKASDLIRAAFEEKYSRWKRQQGRVASRSADSPEHAAPKG